MIAPTNTTIRPVGAYHPVRRMQQPQAPVNPTPGTPSPIGGAAKDFFSDVWTGAKDQLGDYGRAVVSPVDSAKRGWELVKRPGDLINAVVSPYRDAFRAGDPGKALGRLLANVAVVGGAILGGRALLNGGGGARVGSGGTLSNLFGGVGKFVGNIASGAADLVKGAFHTVGNVVRWLLPGGGARVGFR